MSMATENETRHESWATQDVICVLASPKQTPFYIHAFKLIEESPSFLGLARVQKRDENVVQEKAICISDVDVKTMDMVVQWLYNKDFSKWQPTSNIVEHKLSEVNTTTTSAEEVEVEDDGAAVLDYIAAILPTPEVPSRANSIIPSSSDTSITSDTFTLDYADILDIYIFGSRYVFPALCLDSMKCWQRLSLTTPLLPSSTIVTKAYQELAEGSPFTSMIAQQYALQPHQNLSDPSHFRAMMRGFPPAFLIDLQYHNLSISSAKNEFGKYRARWCKFHEHATKEEAARCKEARIKEHEDGVMRKRKGDLVRFDELEGRVDGHAREMKRLKALHPKKCVSTLEVDEDGLMGAGGLRSMDG